MRLNYWYHSRTSFSIILQIRCAIVIEYARNQEPDFACGATGKDLPVPKKL